MKGIQHSTWFPFHVLSFPFIFCHVAFMSLHFLAFPCMSFHLLSCPCSFFHLSLHFPSFAFMSLHVVARPFISFHSSISDGYKIPQPVLNPCPINFLGHHLWESEKVLSVVLCKPTLVRWFAKSHFGNHKGFEAWIFSGGSKSRLYRGGLAIYIYIFFVVFFPKGFQVWQCAS